MVKFYNVKKRESVEIPENQCKKKIYKKTKGGGPKESYALRAVDNDGTNLTKFIKKADFDALNIPQE
jgi:hypothetical protein